PYSRRLASTAAGSSVSALSPWICRTNSWAALSSSVIDRRIRISRGSLPCPCPWSCPWPPPGGAACAAGPVAAVRPVTASVPAVSPASHRRRVRDRFMAVPLRPPTIDDQGSSRTLTSDGGPVHGKDRDRKSTRLNSSHVKISY